VGKIPKKITISISLKPKFNFVKIHREDLIKFLNMQNKALKLYFLLLDMVTN
jgi:hypothetical protein